jgi:hypothetical protein
MNSNKVQASSTKFQTNPNDPNSKSQTNNLQVFASIGIITVNAFILKKSATTAVKVLVIGYCNLRFIWNLVLVIWDLHQESIAQIKRT